MIDALVRELTPLLSEKPYALFGHSMGALLCYELTRQLSLLKKPLPTKIFASGRRAPSVIDPDPVTYNLPHDQFIQELDRLNGTPKEVLQNAELMELLMPTLRADFELCETYEYQSGGEVPCSITAIGGIDDDNASEEELEFWCDHTSKEFKSYRLPGDHFFLHSAEDELLKILHDEL